jgi:hypothetical protein
LYRPTLAQRPGGDYREGWGAAAATGIPVRVQVASRALVQKQFGAEVEGRHLLFTRVGDYGGASAPLERDVLLVTAGWAAGLAFRVTGVQTWETHHHEAAATLEPTDLRLPALAVSGLTQAAGLATLAFSAAHGLSNGQKLLVDGAVPDGYNGLPVIVVTDPTHVTYAVSVSLASPATGTITAKRVS